MNQQEEVVIEGPEPPVEALEALVPREPVPDGLDRAVLRDIQGRLRAERRGPSRRRTALIAVASAVGAAAAAVTVMWLLQPPRVEPGGMTARGTGAAEVSNAVHLDFLVQHPEEKTPSRLDVSDRLRIGDAVYLRAELDQPGTLTFLVASPGEGWESLTTLTGVAGSNDLRRDGRLQVFYVTEAGSHRFAAVTSQGRPPMDWQPGEDELPHITLLGEGAEVAWVEVEAHVKDASR